MRVVADFAYAWRDHHVVSGNIWDGLLFNELLDHLTFSREPPILFSPEVATFVIRSDVHRMHASECVAVLLLNSNCHRGMSAVTMSKQSAISVENISTASLSLEFGSSNSVRGSHVAVQDANAFNFVISLDVHFNRLDVNITTSYDHEADRFAVRLINDRVASVVASDSFAVVDCGFACRFATIHVVDEVVVVKGFRYGHRIGQFPNAHAVVAVVQEDEHVDVGLITLNVLEQV
ncbi:hypothetical protein LdcV14s10gp2 [Cypovirus 14]|uniref:Uncharacterized protein n=1 Tax=Lymantria dispar cypovirus 14 TaxID=165429 RepID=Q91IE2_9REOV|nr:hypothetical protein LdcV14s10gp2 [Cypovirus 14]AAK73096.1 unknown [Lymantria dispar cypovirus 14]